MMASLMVICEKLEDITIVDHVQASERRQHQEVDLRVLDWSHSKQDT